VSFVENLALLDDFFAEDLLRRLGNDGNRIGWNREWLLRPNLKASNLDGPLFDSGAAIMLSLLP
jgi:hypothetical protein